MISKSIEEMIKKDLLTKSPSQVARQYGINYQALMQLNRLRDTALNKVVAPEPEDITTFGKAGMERYVIAIKRTTASEWPDRFAEAIADAREKYDAGTHEMATGRHQGWFVLYLIPRGYPVRSRNYFRSMLNV